MRSQGMDVVDPLPIPFGLNLSTTRQPFPLVDFALVDET